MGESKEYHSEDYHTHDYNVVTDTSAYIQPTTVVSYQEKEVLKQIKKL